MGVGRTGPLAAFVEMVNADWLPRIPSAGNIIPEMFNVINSPTMICAVAVKLRVGEIKLTFPLKEDEDS